ncbi:MAG: sigma-E factor negative regulatory protein [Halioglobus sp.]|nr:sigma-E factor negative regulatory protein [Halioglobus sp.]
MMNERLRESLSAVMDDEANELELERVLSQLSSNGELRQAWSRYHLGRQAMHGDLVAHPDWDISARVQEALGGAATAKESVGQRLLRPLISVGVAASVALTVVVGGQQLAGLGDPAAYPNEQSVAASPSPVGMLNSFGATTLQASYGTQQAIPQLQPVTRAAYEDLARQRMQQYMQQHAEQAALNSPQGLVPFARVPEIRE